MNPWGNIWNWFNNNEQLPKGWVDPNVNYFKEGMPVGTLTSSINEESTFEGALEDYKPKSFMDNAKDAYTETIVDIKNNVNKKLDSTKDSITNTVLAITAIFVTYEFFLKRKRR